MDRDALEKDRVRREARDFSEALQVNERDLSPAQQDFVSHWIERCQKSPTDIVLLNKEKPVQSEVKVLSLADRLQRDCQIISSIEGFKPEAWAKATPYQRVLTLREAEKVLAKTHVRKENRLYAIPNPKDETGNIVKASVTIQERDDWFREDKLHADKHWTETGHVHALDLFKHVTLVDVSDVRSKDPKAAFWNLAHEWRHSYQLAVIFTADTTVYPEIDAKTRELWQNGVKLYHKFPELYAENPIELDANAYATEMTNRLYGNNSPPS